MDLIKNFIGTTTIIDENIVYEKFEDLILREELIILSLKSMRDIIVFTTCRILILDVKGLTGKKKIYLTIPYHSLTHFSFQTAGNFDFNTELNIWELNKNEPIISVKIDNQVDNQKLNIFYKYLTRLICRTEKLKKLLNDGDRILLENFKKYK